MHMFPFGSREAHFGSMPFLLQRRSPGARKMGVLVGAVRVGVGLGALWRLNIGVYCSAR